MDVDPDFNSGFPASALWESSEPYWVTTGATRGSVVVFQETIRDTGLSGALGAPFTQATGEAETVAHEIGHILGGRHQDGDLMGIPAQPIPPAFRPAGSPNATVQFSNLTIFTIQTLSRP